MEVEVHEGSREEVEELIKPIRHRLRELMELVRRLDEEVQNKVPDIADRVHLEVQVILKDDYVGFYHIYHIATIYPDHIDIEEEAYTTYDEGENSYRICKATIYP